MLILHHANIITLDPARPQAELVACKEGRIVAVGGNDLLSQFNGPGVNAIDCHGQTVIPGFNDAHCHVLGLARSLSALDCSPSSVRSIADIRNALRQRALGTPPGTWIVCNGYNPFHLAEGRDPDRHDLDEATTDHPVKLNHFSGHSCVLNSRGLDAAGIRDTTPEPPGAAIDRELETGLPSGLLHEMNHLIDGVMPPPSREQLHREITEANRLLLSHGITSIQDATADNGFARWQLFGRLKHDGLLKSRLTVMAGWQHLDDFREEGLRCNSGDCNLRLGAVKVLLTESTGSVFPSPAELEDLIYRVHEDSGQVAIHGIEESTIETAIAALDNALRSRPRPDHRHRIEHCSECSDSALGRIKALGVAIVTQPGFVYHSGDRYLAQVPDSQQPLLYRIGSFFRAGVACAAGSDSPVVPLRPLTAIFAAVTRKTAGNQSLLPIEAVTPVQALAMHTCNAAFISFEETVKGTISKGKFADMAILSADPTAVPADEIADIVVTQTVLGGNVVWTKGESNH